MGNLYDHNFPSKKCYGRPDIGNVVSRLGCQNFISAWLGKLKPNKLSTGCQNELKGPAVEKATNPGRRFFIFLAASPLLLARFACEFRGPRLCRSCARLDKTAMPRRLMKILLMLTQACFCLSSQKSSLSCSYISSLTVRLEHKIPSSCITPAGVAVCCC